MRTTWTWPAVACIVLAGTLWMVRDESRAAAPAGNRGSVAVVDVGRLFNECQQTKDIDEMLQQIQADVRGKGRKKQEAISQAEQVLDAYNPNSAEGRAQAHKVALLRVEFEAFGTMVQQDIARERKNWTIDTYTKIEQAIAKVAKTHGFELVLSYHVAELQGNDTAAIRREIILREVLYRADRIDLTGEALTLLNKDYDAAGGRNTVKLLIGPQAKAPKVRGVNRRVAKGTTKPAAARSPRTASGPAVRELQRDPQLRNSDRRERSSR